MEYVEFYNFKVHKDIYFLISSITHYDYGELFFDIIGEMSINQFKNWFDIFISDLRDKIDIVGSEDAKRIARYSILSYRDRTCTLGELQEKVCNMSKERFLEMFDITMEDLRTKIKKI